MVHCCESIKITSALKLDEAKSIPSRSSVKWTPPDRIKNTLAHSNTFSSPAISCLKLKSSSSSSDSATLTELSEETKHHI